MEIEEWMKNHNYKNLTDLIGVAQKWIVCK
jgi:hypothetical protein